MDTFVRFLYEFMSVFFEGFIGMFKGVILGFIQMFNIREYGYVISMYRKDFHMGEWILVIIAILVLAIVLALIILVLWFIIRKFLKFRKTLVEQESMLEEIGNLQKEVVKLSNEKDKLLAMKVSQLGLKPDEAEVLSEEETGEEENKEEAVDTFDGRFSKLHEIDVEFANYKPVNYGNTFTLEELVEHFRNFAASKRFKLY